MLRGGKDFSAWVPKDRLLYSTIRVPVEAVLGRSGVGLGDIALAESRYVKGEDITDTFLTLTSRRIEIQRKGTPEMEFVLDALLAWCQCDQGNAKQAVQDISSFRVQMEETGQSQLLSNINALLCRFDLLSGGEYTHMSVSYTHLDVYKRQGVACPGKLQNFLSIRISLSSDPSRTEIPLRS